MLRTTQNLGLYISMQSEQCAIGAGDTEDAARISCILTWQKDKDIQ